MFIITGTIFKISNCVGKTIKNIYRKVKKLFGLKVQEEVHDNPEMLISEKTTDEDKVHNVSRFLAAAVMLCWPLPTYLAIVFTIIMIIELSCMFYLLKV